jgi:hypothetical protein
MGFAVTGDGLFAVTGNGRTQKIANQPPGIS